MTKALRYTNDVNPIWTKDAVGKFRAVGLPDSNDPVVLELDGCCPRCEDPMQHSESQIVFRGISTTSPNSLRAAVKAHREAGGKIQPLLPAEFSMQCSCTVKHPDPVGRSGLIGCGAIWKMRFEALDEDEE